MGLNDSDLEGPSYPSRTYARSQVSLWVLRIFQRAVFQRAVVLRGRAGESTRVT
jgi:hypothetical protein